MLGVVGMYIHAHICMYMRVYINRYIHTETCLFPGELSRLLSMCVYMLSYIHTHTYSWENSRAYYKCVYTYSHADTHTYHSWENSRAYLRGPLYMRVYMHACIHIPIPRRTLQPNCAAHSSLVTLSAP